MIERRTVRECVAESRQWLSSIDAAIFTTFTFDPGFFENNVLSLLFGVQDSAEHRRRCNINNALMRTNVVVFYDKNHSIRHTGKYCYQVSGIKLFERFFHPKLIILAGQMENGSNVVIVTVLSANITMNGWGYQEEVLSTVFIESSRQQGLISSINDFLSFLEKSTQSQYDAINDVKNILKMLPEEIPLTKVRTPDTEIYFGGIKKGINFQEALAEGKTVQRWDRLYAFSPFWHDVKEQSIKFPVREYVFIPTKNEKGLYILTPEQAGVLKSLDRAESVDFMDFKESTYTKGIFRHAKAYFLQKDYKVRIGIGSSNFTSSGLDGDDGNVEAMIIINTDVAHSIQHFETDLKIITINEHNAELEPDSDSPSMVPFDIGVIFDWSLKQFIYSYKIFNKESIDAHLYLPGVQEPIPLLSDVEHEHIAPQMKLVDFGDFLVKYQIGNVSNDYFGIIFEINLFASAKDYVPRLSYGDILDSWRMAGTDVPLSRSPYEWEKDENDDSAGFKIDDLPSEERINIFNYFDDFRAIYDLRSKLREAKKKKQVKVIDGFLYFRPDSIQRLTEALPSIKPLERRYCLAKEIISLLEEYQKYLRDDNLINTVKLIYKESREDLLIKIEKEMPEYSNKNIRSNDILSWFDNKLVD